MYISNIWSYGCIRSIDSYRFLSSSLESLVKTLVDKKNDKVKFDIIPKTNEEYISVIYGCIRFIDSYRFLSSSLDSIFKTIVVNSNKTIKILKEEIVDNDEILNIVNEIEEDDETIKDLKKIIQTKLGN